MEVKFTMNRILKLEYHYRHNPRYVIPTAHALDYTSNRDQKPLYTEERRM